MTPLGELIEEVRTLNRWSYADLADRSATATKPGLSRSNVFRLAKAPILSMPSGETIRALARGLGVPPSVVVERLLDTLELPRLSAWSGSAEEALRRSVDLTNEQKDVLVNMLHLLQRQKPYGDNNKGVEEL